MDLDVMDPLADYQWESTTISAILLQELAQYGNQMVDGGTGRQSRKVIVQWILLFHRRRLPLRWWVYCRPTHRGPKR